MNKTKHYATSSQGIADAAAVLVGGGTIAFPTETVYGLGADATNPDAVAQIYAAKGRPSFNPLIAHVASIEMAGALVEISPDAHRLMQAFWPGDLTLVLPLKADAGVAQAVTAGLPTLAVRMPNHPVATALLRAVNRPIAAPSANPSGRVSPTTTQHVIDGLDRRIDGVVMGPDCAVGVESTILTLNPKPTLLRPGGVTIEEIETVLGSSVHHATKPTKITAPGQMTSHYAPDVPVRLNATTAQGDELLIGFGDIAGERTLSATGNLAEAAEALFATLLDCETQGRPIAFAPIPTTGIGLAINDRLTRAAAPKD
ncbi:MAG: L-threonylcarbamoyladenylate synthase [Planktomarina sp.]